MARAWIGVSGWQYPDFTERFYPEDMEKSKQLTYYAKHFVTVEINNTFYGLPHEKTISNWYNLVPPDFVFSVKASRYITHMKNLIEPEKTLPGFFTRIKGLKHKSGPILFQLPPQWRVDEARLKNFLSHLPEDFRYTIEFRNQTWFREDIYHLLRKHNVAFCVYEIDFKRSPILATANFLYIRLHGPGRAYNDPYDLNTLRSWADRINFWVNSGLDVYCYFDNTHRGYAWENAQTLMNLLNKERSGK